MGSIGRGRRRIEKIRHKTKMKKKDRIFAAQEIMFYPIFLGQCGGKGKGSRSRLRLARIKGGAISALASHRTGPLYSGGGSVQSMQHGSTRVRGRCTAEGGSVQRAEAVCSTRVRVSLTCTACSPPLVSMPRCVHTTHSPPQLTWLARKADGRGGDEGTLGNPGAAWGGEGEGGWGRRDRASANRAW